MIRYVLDTLRFRSAFAVGIGLPFLAAASAYAQAPAPEATTERVIVTGSYIPTAETESALPVTVYTAEVLQKQGANTPVEGLRELPSFVGNTFTENTSNGGNGSASVNLRALGPENTLTLVNGRRTFNFSDVNAISIGSLSRSEVLKDGASAIYGSDAVAGVVNFILLNGPGEKPYEGAEIFALYGNTTETDAHVRQVYVRGGVTGLDNKVSIAASGEYYSRANLYSRDRAQLAGTGNTSNFPADPFYPNSGGLGRGGLNNNSPFYPGRLRISGLNGGQMVLVNPFNNNPVPVFDGSNPRGYRRFENDPLNPGARLGGTDPSRYNFREQTPSIPAQEKAMYMVTGRYKVFGEAMQIYGDIMYSKTKQDNGLAPSPFTQTNLKATAPASAPPAGNISGISIIRRSQFNPFGNTINELRYRFRTEELGNRRDFFDTDYYRYVTGVNGDFNFKDNGFISRLGYDSAFVYERYDQLRTDTGDGDGRLLGQEIFDGNFNPFIGQLAPLQGTATTYLNGVATGTAAYDNAAAAKRSLYLGHSNFKERDWLVDAKINANLFPNLWNGGIGTSIGFEHREVAQNSFPDPVQATNNQLGFNQAPLTKYRQEVTSVFGEITVPIITSTMNIPFVRSLEIGAAYRYEQFDDYDLFFQNPLTDHIKFDNGGTPRVSLRYQPIADVTLRAGWNQSFRSATPGQLFDPGTGNNPTLFDPLKFSVQQVSVQQVGNIDLQPEETDTYSAGVVWTPKFVPGFTMTADFYQIFTTSLILDSASFAQIMLTANGLSGLANGGVPTLFAPPAGPGVPVVNRQPGAFGDIVNISNATTNNAGKRFVEGLDVTAVYELPTERFGKFTLSGGWNHFFAWKVQGNPELAPGFTNFLGNYNNGTQPLAPGAIPVNKAFLRGEWEWRGFDFVATGRYIGDFEDDPAFLFGNTVLGGSIANPDFALHHRVSSYETLDMRLSYEFQKPAVTEPAPTYAKDAKDGKAVAQTTADSSTIWQRMLWNTTLSVGVNNVFDRYPPTVLGAFNDNYDTSLYSIRNRYWYVSLNKKF